MKPGRARNAVLTGLGAVLLAQVGFNLLLETRWPDLRDPEYGCRLTKLRRLVEEGPPESPVVVALGSSRTQMGLRPDVMGRADDGRIVFNFGMAGCGPLGEWITLNRLLKAGIRPDHLLIEILPPALHMDGDGPDFVQLPKLGLSDLRVLEPYCQNPRDVVRDWCEHRVSPICATRFCLVSKVVPNWLPFSARVDYMWETVDAFGWLPYPRDDVPAEKRAEGVARAREQYSAHMTGFHVSPIPDRALRDILDTCATRGIGATLYRMPEGESFRENYTPDALEQIDRYLGGLADEYGVGLIDATDWIAESDFSDGHHLLSRGAALFSERFAGEVWRAAAGARP